MAFLALILSALVAAVSCNVHSHQVVNGQSHTTHAHIGTPGVVAGGFAHGGFAAAAPAAVHTGFAPAAVHSGFAPVAGHTTFGAPAADHTGFAAAPAAVHTGFAPAAVHTAGYVA